MEASEDEELEDEEDDEDEEEDEEDDNGEGEGGTGRERGFGGVLGIGLTPFIITAVYAATAATIPSSSLFCNLFNSLLFFAPTPLRRSRPFILMSHFYTCPSQTGRMSSPDSTWSSDHSKSGRRSLLMAFSMKSLVMTVGSSSVG
jgi:hypothetical protein